MNKYYLTLLILLVGFTFFITDVKAQDNEKIKLLNEKLIAAKHDSERVVILGDLSWEYQTFNIDKAEQYALQELKIAKKLDLKYFNALAYNDLGLVKFRKGSFGEAMKFTKQAYEIRKELGDEMGMASSLNKIGNIYQRSDNNAEALKAFLQCLKVYEKNNVKPYIAFTLNNIATIYFNLHQSDKAMNFYRQALISNRELGNVQDVAANLGNMANIHIQQKKFDTALIELYESVKIFKSIGNKYSLPTSINSIAMAYRFQLKFKEALPFNLESFQLAKEIKDTSSIILYANNTASSLLHLNRKEEAKELIDMAFQIATISNRKDFFKQLYVSYMQYYSQSNNADQADKYFKLYDGLRDSLVNKTLSMQIAEMETKFETEKKEQENLLLKKDNKIKSLSLWFLIIGLLLTVATFYLIFNRNKMKQKTLLQAEMLKQQELRSKAVLDAEETERQRIAKDLHDGIGQMLSAVKLNLSTVQSKITINENEKLLFQNAISLVDDSVKEVRSISHNMMPNMLIKKGLANAVRDFIDKLSGTTLKIDLEITGMNERLESTLESILFRVLQELVNNIIKHAQANHITIQLLKFENEITIMIEDNGVGFKVDDTLQSDKGIGLKNIISRIDFLKGNINFDSTINKGTTVTIDIPLG